MARCWAVRAYVNVKDIWILSRRLYACLKSAFQPSQYIQGLNLVIAPRPVSDMGAVKCSRKTTNQCRLAVVKGARHSLLHEACHFAAQWGAATHARAAHAARCNGYHPLWAILPDSDKKTARKQWGARLKEQVGGQIVPLSSYARAVQRRDLKRL